MTAYRFGLVLEKPHGVFDDDFVFKPNEFDDLFGDPRTHDLEVDLAHVDFAVKLWGEFHGLEETMLLVGKAPVLLAVSTCTHAVPNRPTCSVDVPLKNPASAIVVVWMTGEQAVARDILHVI